MTDSKRIGSDSSLTLASLSVSLVWSSGNILISKWNNIAEGALKRVTPTDSGELTHFPHRVHFKQNFEQSPENMENSSDIDTIWSLNCCNNSRVNSKNLSFPKRWHIISVKLKMEYQSLKLQFLLVAEQQILLSLNFQDWSHMEDISCLSNPENENVTGNCSSWLRGCPQAFLFWAQIHKNTPFPPPKRYLFLFRCARSQGGLHIKKNTVPKTQFLPAFRRF